MDEILTPTEDLVMEVLGARHRLGEPIWTFESRHRRVIESLRQKGLVSVIHGIVDGTVRAALTETGRDLVLDEGYQPPALRTQQQATARAWSAFLGLALDQTLDDGESLIDVALTLNPGLRSRLRDTLGKRGDRA